jgi:hypothetical protein
VVSGAGAAGDPGEGEYPWEGEVALVTVPAGAAPGALPAGVAVVTASDGADEDGLALLLAKFGVALDWESAISLTLEPPE